MPYAVELLGKVHQVRPAGADLFVLELPEHQPDLDPAEAQALGQRFAQETGHKLVIIPFGTRFRAASPYYVRESCEGWELEVGYATLDEVLDHFERDGYFKDRRVQHAPSND